AQVIDLQSADDLAGDFARRASQMLTQGHGAVRLIVAELRILTGANVFDQLGGIVTQRSKRSEKTGFQFVENIHASHRARENSSAGIISTGGCRPVNRQWIPRSALLAGEVSRMQRPRVPLQPVMPHAQSPPG